MTESQIELEQEVKNLFNAYRRLMPEIADAYDALPQEVYKDGALSGKIKRLMALSGAMVHGCRACILFQTEQAINLGASVEEILEACSVAISLGGTMAAGETTRVIKFLQEKSIIEV
ncbi:MAG: carboxymuconolactone decarboxylase family protein [Desulfobacterales bacterium]|nr:carboxymuconolactone decarboxylase family protein [Desulfobacterales bacterium]